MSKEPQCTITTHEITDDGMGCQCGYLVKESEVQEAYKRGYIDSGIASITDNGKQGQV